MAQEAFADSVAATVTGDSSANSHYYGSPRDNFVHTLLCEAVDASNPPPGE
ncbi:MAG: hypothetical protein U0841_02240 [Chloroflexia bacterium]